uniref:CHAD domain-containing protein n=1 Tax=Macrostomum lignano TaxID=282301 RepID=A0A1I8H792_9PLAT
SNGVQANNQFRVLIREFRKARSQASEQNRNLLGQITQLRNMLEKQLKGTKAASSYRKQNGVIKPRKLHIRSQSVTEWNKRFREGERAWLRDMRRSLLFRFRINRIKRHEQVVDERLKQLKIRMAALAKHSSIAQTERARMKLGESKSANITKTEVRTSQQPSKRILLIQQAALRRRIRRLSKRRQIFWRRIALLKKRVRLQLADSNERYWPMEQFIERWKPYDLRRLARFSIKDDPISSRRHLDVTSRADVKTHMTLADRIDNRMKHIESHLRYEYKKIDLLKTRKIYIRHRQFRLRRRLFRLRVRRRQLERLIDATETGQRRTLGSFIVLTKVPKQKQVPSSKAIKRGARVSATNNASLRIQRDNLVSRIRAIAAKRRRLAQRATAIRCRIRVHNRRLRQLAARRQRFLRRLNRNGLSSPS